MTQLKTRKKSHVSPQTRESTVNYLLKHYYSKENIRVSVSLLLVDCVEVSTNEQFFQIAQGLFEHFHKYSAEFKSHSHNYMKNRSRTNHKSYPFNQSIHLLHSSPLLQCYCSTASAIAVGLHHCGPHATSLRLRCAAKGAAPTADASGTGCRLAVDQLGVHSFKRLIV